MTIHWSLLVPGVVLLLFLADRLLSRRVELRSFGCFHSLEDSPRQRPWWWVPALWVDPLRGFVGTLLLREAFALKVTPWVPLPLGASALALSILIAGILCQMVTRRGGRGVLLAPMGFVAGAVLALAPWLVSLLAIATAAVGLFAFRQFHAFFTAGLMAIALLGVALGADAAWIGAATGAFALPLAAGLATGSALELPTRNPSGPARSPLPLA